ncbi:MAG TPA: hypothetical protein DD723_00030 [Candidatus Omnitrophica bacterium]|nr:MAG: hypothetical protein A2Z81_02605 [Omnitrophica WOR_2 bacterium GWA2_45_18]OGX19514.1 MAG: hypothetical protein A2Y04_05845 [Omnitrophica WOR_2 bacterium GWC2_45_7]HBR13922.1 hypothetical protein [Candidatus Omnitrophota bacterium]
MKRAYYYFIASLPVLKYDENPPFSLEEFLRDCLRFLSKEDYRLIDKLLRDEDFQNKKDKGVSQAWVEFNRDLRNEIAWYRAKRNRKDPKEFLRKERTGDSYLTEIVVQASKAADPLAGERIFDAARWQLLDGLLTAHYFDREILFVYGLKLKILERFQKLNSPQGQAAFDEYKNIVLPELSLVS